MSASGMDMRLKKSDISDVMSIGPGILRGNNPQNNIFVPSLADLGGSVTDTGGKFGIGSLVTGDGVGSGNRLISTTGLGITKRSREFGPNEEMDDATSYREGVSPYSPYFDLPSPDDDEVLISGYNASEYYSGEDDLSTIGARSNSTNQGIMFNYGDLQDLNNNIAIGQASLYDLEVETNQIKEQQQLALDAIDDLYNKKQELLDSGLDFDNPQILELDQQIDQQTAMIDEQDNRLNELSDDITSLADEVEEQISRKEGLLG
jgi:hypothetical protein